MSERDNQIYSLVAMNGINIHPDLSNSECIHCSNKTYCGKRVNCPSSKIEEYHNELEKLENKSAPANPLACLGYQIHRSKKSGAE